MNPALLDSPADKLPVPKVDADGDAEQQETWETALYQMVSNARLHIETLSADRATAEKYYKGEPLGNEKDGRSKIVMTELRDAVLMIMPSLMEIFFSPDPACEYVPENTKAETVKKAEQITQFIMDVVLMQDNSGFLVFHDWFKDALIKRLGIVKYWQDDSREHRSYTACYMSIEQLTLLAQDTSIEVESVTPTEDAPPGVYDVDYTQHKQWSRTRLVCVPPEEYLFTKGARTAANDPAVPGVADFVGHQTQMTRGQLEAIGVSKEDIEQYAFPDMSLEGSPENVVRNDGEVPNQADATVLEENQRALYIEGYPFIDLDDDKGLRLCKVTMLGPAFHIIDGPTPCARRPFAILTPDPTPHTIIGQGINDYTMDLQMLTSMVWRALLNSLTLSINPRIVYVDGEVSLADIQNVELSAPIRARSLNAVQELTHEFVGGQALPVLDAIAGIKENRVGVTKASAGLDASALQSSSAAAVSAAVTNAQKHIQMIARVFAETGVRDLMKGLLELQVENQNGPRIAKVAGDYIEMDPRSWDANLDVRINIAIGAGTTQERIAVLQDVATRMENIFGTWGPGNPMVGPKEYRDTIVKMLKARGRADAASFFKEVDPNWQPPKPDPSQGDPNMVIAQAEATKAATDAAVKQHGVQLDEKKHQIEAERRASEQQLKIQDLEMNDALEREKIEADITLRLMEMRLKYNTQLSIEQLKAEMASLRAAPKTTKVKLAHKDGHEVHVEETQ
jgi:hypothetical protein